MEEKEGGAPPTAAGEKEEVASPSSSLHRPPTPSSPPINTKVVDAWLQEMGRIASDAARTSAAGAQPPAFPAPGMEGLRTLCILAKASIPFLQQGHHHSSSSDFMAARLYLQTLAVRGQLALRPGNPRAKQETAVKRITDALATHREAAHHLPNWTMRLVLVVVRLLCSLHKKDRAIAFLEAHLPLVEASPFAAPVSKAYLLLQYTQVLYYDQCALKTASSATQLEGWAKAETACRVAVRFVQQAMGASSSPYLHALMARATFRLLDLLLAGPMRAERATQEEALELCRTCLRHVAPTQFSTVGVYLATVLQALGQGGATEAAVEIQVEKDVREEKPLPSSAGLLPSSASLLNMRGLEDLWALPADSWQHQECMNAHLRHLHRRYHQQQTLRRRSRRVAMIPTTEEKEEGEAMNVCHDEEREEVKMEERAEEEEEEASFWTPPPPRPETPVQQMDVQPPSSSSANKRTRRSPHYPIFHQITSRCVTLPRWATVA